MHGRGVQWWIQDFPEGVCQLPKVLLFSKFFAEKCMKMKEFGPVGGTHPWGPFWIRQWGCAWQRVCVVVGGVCGGGMHGRGCAWQGGGRAWQERRPTASYCNAFSFMRFF